MHGAATLYEVANHLASGFPMPLAFNASESVFPPKGSRDDDARAVIRRPDETRPLSMKNADNKTICRVLNGLIRHIGTRHVAHIQRGFVAGRQLTQNIVDLDAAARAFGHRELASSAPVLAFWDVAAAFPSLQHA